MKILYIILLILIYCAYRQFIYLWMVDIYDRLTFNSIFNLNKSCKLPINRQNNRILIISFDNRYNKLIYLHNKNFENYCDKWNIQYKFYNTCQYNIYWCKIHLVLADLQTNNYDYVMWADSDTVVINDSIDLNDIINCYSSDIIIGEDVRNVTNSGLFIIKNSEIGKQFLLDCIQLFNSRKDTCLNNNNELLGLWSMSCYEQGIMNEIIAKKYNNYTSLVPKNIFKNINECNVDTFILHYFGAKRVPKDREQCFNNYVK